MNSVVSRLSFKVTVFVVVGLSMCVALVAFAIPHVGAYAVGRHQQHTTKELQLWADEYRSLEDAAEVGLAIDMLEYIPNYYPVQEGYRSDPTTEAALERQREETIAAIISGLREYSSEDYGDDVTQWRDWHVKHHATK